MKELPAAPDGSPIAHGWIARAVTLLGAGSVCSVP
jgi:hypothetical protein